MDEFQEKRNMIQMLLQMLKQSAVGEVENGMKAPEPALPEHGLEIDKLDVSPEDKEEEMSPGETKSDDSLADQIMHKGEPEADAHADESDEEDSSPAFASFMKKKGKK